MLVVVSHLGHLIFNGTKFFVHCLDVQFGNLLHRFFYKLGNVVHNDRPSQKVLIFKHFIEDFLEEFFPGNCIILQYLEYLVLEEDFLKRSVMPVILQFIKPYLKFHPEQPLSVFGTISQHIVHSEEMRLLLHNHTSIRRNGYLAIGKGIERIDGLVR